MEFIDNKCKDESPINTINNIRNILRNIGMPLLIEKFWGNPLDDFWSVHITLPDTDIFANGKGTSPEFALASAYSEFLERLQNQAYFFVLDRDYDDKLYEEMGFCHAPDEKHVSISDIKKDESGDMEYVYGTTRYSSDNDERWEDFSKETPKYSENRGDFISIPFYDITHSHMRYLPLPFLKYYYGTNGMCSGNTPEEAVVQGICEIMERYVNREILSKNLSYPTIPDDYLERFGHWDAIISKIESLTNYKIIVKDYSSDTGFPVLGLILLDMENKAYFVKFGAHPVFQIALERCFTELFQGRSHMNFPFEPFDYLNGSILNKTLSEENMSSIFASGVGNYPPSLLSDVESHSTPNWNEFSKNKDILKYLIDLIEKRGLNILIRNVSFLGFPSYHVVIPGLSEIFRWNSKQCKKISMKQEVRATVRHIDKSDDEKLKKILTFVESDYADSKTIDMLTGLPLKDSFPWKTINYALFLSTAYYRIGDIKKAHQHMEKYVKYLTNLNGNKEHNQKLNYYRCVRDYLATFLDNDDKKKTLNILNQVYGEALMKEVIDDLKDPCNVFRYYPRLSCWDCDSCNLIKHCYYQKTRDVIVRIRKCMQENPIDQNCLRLVFQGGF